MELSQSQKQTQTLSPQMMQSMKILQMGIQELREYIEEAIQENPVLELPEPGEEIHREEDFTRKLEWLEANDCQNTYYHRQDAEGDENDPLANVGCFLDEEEDLERYILSQFMGTDLEPEVMRGVEFLVSQLDQNGFLDEELPALAEAAGLSQQVIGRALIELQAAEPAGVGARSLTECLRLQIERRAGDHRVALMVVERYLDELARARYGLISRELNVPEKDVRAACDLIRTLNPRPATGFAARENLVYITPDVQVVTFPDHFEITANDTLIPQLKLSSYYSQLMKETQDREVKDYLSEKANQAKWVVRSIDQRRSTLLQCAQWVVERQELFFRHGPGHLRPLTMGEVADQIGVHESTVSRTVRDKYLQCDWGVYPLSYFFSRSLGTQDGSPEAAKILLKRLVEEEDKPLSDQKLCEEMARRGCILSRRTVAKYREELNIPNASGRKK
ncbi:MAG: RNA polymerase factor sigma-54 [Oscillospiraceae bacterium]|jgi:RNA polymerase sigma-54 factor